MRGGGGSSSDNDYSEELLLKKRQHIRKRKVAESNPIYREQYERFCTKYGSYVYSSSL